MYALLPDKTAATYTWLFNFVRVQILQRFPDIGRINGGKWHFDYEDAAINSFSAVFPEAEGKGCTFHYAQALIENRTQLGLTIPYRQIPAVLQFFRRLVALCLLPERLVVLAANGVLANVPPTANAQWDQALADFVIYFRNQWLRPNYLPIWNQWNNDGPRTTNHVEGWHNSLRHKLPHEHPDLGIFLHHAKRWWHIDSVRIRNLIHFPANNPPVPRRPIDIIVSD